MTLDPLSLSARNLANHIARGTLSPVEVTRATLDRVAALNPQINAIVQECGDEAMEAAEALEKRIKAGGRVGKLAGVPVTIKVITDQAGHATTNGTKLAADLVADEDSPFVERMRAEDALIIGRTNTPAFSYRWFTSNVQHGTTLNPRNADLTPGGSSGGAGAATAAGLGHIAHGTDIAGSIRYPAYACGVQGLRPSVGRVPSYNMTGGARPIGPQLMAVSGPLALRVDDLRLALEVMSGEEPGDPLSYPVPLTGPDLPRRAALVRRPDGMAVDPRILDDLDRAAAMLRAAGWEVEEPASVPALTEAKELQIDLWLMDGFAEKAAAAEAEGDPGALALIGRFAARAADFQPNQLSAVLQRRLALMREWRMFLSDYPVVLMPVSGELPFEADEDLTGADALNRIWDAQLSQIALPLLALPGLSVCSGIQDGVPSGVQIVTPPWREDIALLAGEVLEQGFGTPQPWQG